MKKIITVILFLLLLFSCAQKEMQFGFASSDEFVPSSGDSNEVSLKEILSVLDTIGSSQEENAITKDMPNIKPGDLALGDSVDLKKELTDLFNPDKFDCGCDGKFKSALRRIKSGTKDTIGFVPKIVMNRVYKFKKVVKLEDRGSYILSYLFHFTKKDGSASKPVRAKPENVSSFNQFDYIERSEHAYSNFLYTLDCSGYLSMAIAVAGGISKASIKASAKSASTSKKSLFVLKGVLYSPLYQAYLGTGKFSKTDSTSIFERLQVLRAILIKIPKDELSPSTKIYLNSSYLVLLTSNTGETSFNGDANIEGSTGANFGVVSISGEAKAGGSISRTSNFSDYNTYILEANIDEEVSLGITVAEINSIIRKLEKQLRSIST